MNEYQIPRYKRTKGSNNNMTIKPTVNALNTIYYKRIKQYILKY